MQNTVNVDISSSRKETSPSLHKSPSRPMPIEERNADILDKSTRKLVALENQLRL